MIVYKFRGINEYTFQLLEKNEFYLSYPQEFNDPFDCITRHSDFSRDKQINKNLYNEKFPEFRMVLILMFNTEKFDSIWLENTKKLLSHPKYKSAWLMIESFYNSGKLERKKLLELLQMYYLVSCFAHYEERNNILMWSHYAQNHKGIAIGFQTEIIEGNYFVQFEKNIKYDNWVNVPESYYMLEKIKYETSYPKPFDIYNDEINRMKEFYLTKGKEWEYENEYRLAFPASYVSQFSNNRCLKFDKKILRQIIFGLNTSLSDENRIRQIIENNYTTKGYNINYYKCYKKDEEYGIRIEQID